MQIDNSLNSILNNPLLNNQQNSPQNITTKEAQKPAEATSSESKTEESSEEKREDFGVPLLNLMNEEEYNSFLRATKEQDDSTKSRYANSLQMFSATFINATTNSSNGMSLLNDQDSSLESLLGDSAMLKISEFSIREGADILKNMAGENENMLDFMQRLKNALSSGKGIDVAG
ncbi:MAG: hypothetical protein ACLFQJ_08580 [Campylobacterales bacterium]